MDLDKYAVGKAIKRLWKEKGILQEVLSWLAGLAGNHLTMIETVTKKANFATPWRILNAPEILPNQLVKYIEDENIKQL